MGTQQMKGLCLFYCVFGLCVGRSLTNEDRSRNNKYIRLDLPEPTTNIQPSFRDAAFLKRLQGEDVSSNSNDALAQSINSFLLENDKRSGNHKDALSFQNLIKLIQQTSDRIHKMTRNSKPEIGENDDVKISTVVETWAKNTSGKSGGDNLFSGYKTEVETPKRAGRLSINGALSSLADLLVSENQRRDRMETMELRQRLQYLG